MRDMLYDLTVIMAIAAGYLLGSVPFAYIAGRLNKRVDIRQVGGGNVGTLNTLREIGTAAGLAVLLADTAKGAVSVLIARWLGLSLAWTFAAGFAAVVGHSWPVFLGFKGGKGAATTLGVLLALVPREFAISLAIMLIAVIITSNIRLALFIGLALLPLIAWRFDEPGTLIAFCVALPLFVLARSIPGFRKEIVRGGKKGLIFDREYHFWQRRKQNKVKPDE